MRHGWLCAAQVALEARNPNEPGQMIFEHCREVVTDKGTKFWVITETDRSVTTVLLPEDY